MARGGARPGAGRKAKGPRVQIPVRVSDKLRHQLELLAKRNGDISLTKQTQQLLVKALSSPQWSDRLEERLRQQIEVAAERNGRSLHAEIVERLERSLWAGNEDHNQSLGLSVARLAWMVEGSTGLRPLPSSDGPRWLDHRWAARAVRAAVDKFLQAKMPTGPDDPPERVKQMSDASPELAALYSSPEAYGAMLADSLLNDLQTYKERPPRDRPNEFYADIFEAGPYINKGFERQKREG
jgi:Arc-like DNA binding domain